MKRALVFLIAALLLAACATYRPRPLDSGTDILGAPASSAFTVNDSAISLPIQTPTTIDLSKPLNSDAIATIAVIANPDLKAERARAGVANAQAFNARLLPDPTFNAGADKIFSGPDPLPNLAAALAFDLNALRTRGVRLAQAKEQENQVRLDLAWAEWQTGEKARIEAVRVLGLERAQQLTQASSNATASLLDRTLRAAGRGDLTPEQVQTMRLAALDAADRLRTTEHDLVAARHQLTSLLGLPPDTSLSLASADPPAAPPSADKLFALAQAHRFDLQALRAGYAAQEAAVHKSILDQFPDLTLAINSNRDTTGNKLLGPAVDFTLPVWNRNRGGVAVERATRDALKAEYNARLFQTRADIASAVAAISVARRQRETVLQQLPALKRFAEASLLAAGRGDLSEATAEAAEQSLRDKELLLAQSDQDIAEQTIALELLTGVPRREWEQ